ncbi:hypothetical protein HAX54_022161 [Datura stramonium]|uniref:MARVEL domain-containing protein n=1 Tax=Datura stramonium TaxID=4076 RepID=A0ABS8UW91_DATST|nr:hypothetical protein [Datura stramonium]
MYTQISTSKRRRSPNTTHMTDSTVPFTLVCVQNLLIIFNTVSMIYKTYINSQYSLLAFVLFIYFSSFLAFYLSSIHQSLPLEKHSLEKSLLGFVIWFLFSSITFGFVYQFYPLFGFWAGLSICMIAIASSGVMFYDYVVCDYQDQEDGGHNWRCFGSNDQMKRSYCEGKWEIIWEKV